MEIEIHIVLSILNADLFFIFAARETQKQMFKYASSYPIIFSNIC